MTERSPYTVPALILGLSLLAGTLVVSQTMYSVKSLSNYISVTGSAQKQITSDTAKWRANLERSVGMDGLKEGSAQLDNDLKALRAYLKKNGIEESAITIAPVSVETLINYNVNAPSGYKLTQSIIVQSSDVQKITSLAQGASSLLGQGAVVSTVGLEYYYSKLNDLKVDMLAAATANAQARATKIAESAGTRLGSLRSADMGVLQVTAVNSVDISDYGSYDTSSIQKQITAVVRASFAVR